MTSLNHNCLINRVCLHLCVSICVLSTIVCIRVKLSVCLSIYCDVCRRAAGHHHHDPVRGSHLFHAQTPTQDMEVRVVASPQTKGRRNSL